MVVVWVFLCWSWWLVCFWVGFGCWVCFWWLLLLCWFWVLGIVWWFWVCFCFIWSYLVMLRRFCLCRVSFCFVWVYEFWVLGSFWWGKSFCWGVVLVDWGFVVCCFDVWSVFCFFVWFWWSCWIFCCRCCCGRWFFVMDWGWWGFWESCFILWWCWGGCWLGCWLVLLGSRVIVSCSCILVCWVVFFCCCLDRLVCSLLFCYVCVCVVRRWGFGCFCWRGSECF